MENKQRQFRDVVGNFATGVTVVTTVNSAGQPRGMTANSFSSLSLEPPLILWNLGDHAAGYEDFKNASHFAVHFLHAGQQDISNHFAKSSDDKFVNTNWTPGVLGSPILGDYHACLQCSMEAIHQGGDHLIIVGRVQSMEMGVSDQGPLLFYRGRYHQLAE